MSFKKLRPSRSVTLFRKWAICNLPPTLTVYPCFSANHTVRSVLLLHQLLHSLSLTSLCPAPCCCSFSLSLLSQGHALINTSGLMSFSISWYMRAHTHTQSHTHTHTVSNTHIKHLYTRFGFALFTTYGSGHEAVNTFLCFYITKREFPLISYPEPCGK